jgi:hypothetical protein
MLIKAKLYKIHNNYFLPRTCRPAKIGKGRRFIMKKAGEKNAPSTEDRFAFIKTKNPLRKNQRGQYSTKVKTLNLQL